MSMESSPRLSSPRTGIVALANQPNAWQLMNTKGIDLQVEQKLGNIPKGRIFIGKDGVIAVLTEGSSKHLCSKHGHQVGINDPLPPNPNAKVRKHPQIRTKTDNPANELFFANIVERVIESTTR